MLSANEEKSFPGDMEEFEIFSQIEVPVPPATAKGMEAPVEVVQTGSNQFVKASDKELCPFIGKNTNKNTQKLPNTWAERFNA